MAPFLSIVASCNLWLKELRLTYPFRESERVFFSGSRGDQKEAWRLVAKGMFERVEAVPVEGGYAIELNGRPLRSPGGRFVVVPSRGLAAAIAQEWAAQENRPDPKTLPLSRLAQGATDLAAQSLKEVRADLVQFSASDLLCYRAAYPEALRQREAACWDPVLDWVNERFATSFCTTAGIGFVAQPEDSLARIARYLEGLGPFELVPLKVMSEISGSLFLALAVAAGALTSAAAWQAAQIDEDWQRSRWGGDEEARAITQARAQDFEQAARFLKLIQPVTQD